MKKLSGSPSGNRGRTDWKIDSSLLKQSYIRPVAYNRACPVLVEDDSRYRNKTAMTPQRVSKRNDMGVDFPANSNCQEKGFISQSEHRLWITLFCGLTFLSEVDVS